jgi:predicted alpha/beta superfamily hydrolase
MRLILFVVAIISIVSCNQNQQLQPASSERPMMYSTSVQDSFRIYTSAPSDSSKHPLIILLDANAYFEPVVAEYNLGKLTQGYPDAIIVGIGYKDFYTLDSLRDRDYTFPVANPQDSFAISGGGKKFKQFIDDELIPGLKKKHKIDESNVTLIGHSLGGYFVLYHLLESINQKNYPITNYVAASPALHYHNYLMDNLKVIKTETPLKLYSSMGTREYGEDNRFLVLKHQVESSQMNASIEEYSNFDHMDAAIPGFMKGLTFTLNVE